MHNESMMVAGVLAVIGVLFAAQKSRVMTRIGMVFAGLAALMLIAGVNG